MRRRKLWFLTCTVCTALALFLLCACGQKTEQTEQTGNPGEAGDTGTISVQALSGYRVTRSDFNPKGGKNASVALRRAIADVTGTEPPIGTDWDDGSGIPDEEILVGKTNRPESEAFAETFASSGADCAYGVLNGKVILYGKDDENLMRIEAKFEEDVLGVTKGQNGEPASVLREGSFTGFTCEEKLLLEDGSEPHSSLRSDILWGVNGHNKLHAPYGEANTAEILRLAAEMGSTVYRINYNPTTTEMVSYITDIIDRCHAYGMKVVLCMDDRSGTPEEISERMTYIAEHMKGKADYFQLFNEMDIWCAQTDDGTYYNPTNWKGETREYYNPERVPVAVEKMRAAVDAFRKAAPEAKLMINVGACHYPMLDWFVEAGISWDIIGFDLYDISYFKLSEFLGKMEERYPGYDFMIAECNYPVNNGKYLEEEQAAWLKNFFTLVNDCASERLIGVEVYELMDESTIQQDDEHWNGEAHFGIVNTGADGKPGPVKEAYRTLQTMLCGGKAEYRTVYTPVG